MKQIPALICMSLLTCAHLVVAQQEPVRQHLYVTDNTTSHLFLQLHVPAGELFVQESQACGMTKTRIVSPDTSTKWIMRNSRAQNGNLIREAVVHHEAIAERQTGEQSSLRQVYRVDPMATQREAREIVSEYCLDPTLSTDLSMYLGRGSSMIDLSNLSLNTLSIESVFSDLVLTYSKPNQMPMQKLHIHAANANVVLKHLELSRAGLVHVQNDMGDTKLMLGPNRYSDEESPVIELRNGVGDCLLVIDSNHPVRVVVNKGVLASAEADIDSGFIRMEERGQLTYQNKAAEELEDEDVTMIHCDLDFGELILFTR